MLGGKWKPIVIFHLLAGPQRNGELLRLVPGITQKMLTAFTSFNGHLQIAGSFTGQQATALAEQLNGVHQ